MHLAAASLRLNFPLHVYGDPAFALTSNIQVGWRPSALATVSEKQPRRTHARTLPPRSLLLFNSVARDPFPTTA